MFESWGRTLYRRRRLTLGLALLFVIFAAVWGTGVFGRLSSGDNFTPPSSQSQREANQADQVFGRNDADVVVLYRSATMTVADPAYRQAVTTALDTLPRADVAGVSTYWSTGSPSLVSNDRRATYAVLQLTGADDAARHTTYDAIKAELTPASLAANGVSAEVGGNVPTEVAINNEVTADIAKAEGFSMPVLLILLMVIFGSLAAASLPVAIGGVAILGSFTVLRLLTMATTVSIYSVNITTILGLGLGIDYGLFMVTRFREELHRQDTVELAVARTVATAGLIDELSSLGSTLPWMALLVCVSTFVLLFLAFGSVVLPLKAIVMNVLSLSATFGIVVWIFQWGHLSGLLRFTPTGSIDPTMPILMLAIIFGLSMDYEVFLLSRIRERYDQTGDNTVAVATGLQRTGGVITSLALLLIIVIGAFSASGITFIKLMGVGMIVALIVDASVVRILLVPATMRLLGRANWWAPRPLRRLYGRYGIREETPAPAVPVPAGTEG
ncbi:MAG: MMPL family transporter [Streptosporangiaceae bacterium]